METRKKSEDYRCIFQKLSGLLVMCCALVIMVFCMNVNTEAAQTTREDTRYIKIKEVRSGKASSIEFDAYVDDQGSKYIDIYRSEPSVENGGTWKKLDRFLVIGDIWKVIDDDHYLTYGDKRKVICYSGDVVAYGNLTFQDITTKAGHEYSYRIAYSDYVWDPDNYEDEVKITSNTVTVKATLQTPELYKCYSTDNKEVKLSWSYINQAEGYKIYRYYNGLKREVPFRQQIKP